MLTYIKLRALYALHILLPLAVVRWHIDRLDLDTLRGLASLARRVS